MKFYQLIWLAVLWLLKAEAMTKSAHPKAGLKLRERADYLKQGSYPRIIQSPVDKTIKEGKGVALHCAAMGSPKLRIRWKKNGDTIAQNERIKIRTTDRNRTRESTSKLRIRNAIPGDSGVYHCVAKNSLGYSKSIEATLDVREENIDKKRGTCKPYTGTVCSSILEKDSRVFIPLKKSQKFAEERVIEAIKHLKGGYILPSCEKILMKMLCYYFFPPCQTVKPVRPWQICEDECEMVQGRICSKEFHLLRQRLGTSADDKLPNCSTLPSAGVDSGAAHCLQLGINENTAVPGRESCHETTDTFPSTIRPLDSKYPICDEKITKEVKIYNKEVFHLLRNVQTEIHSGRMSLTVHSSELSSYCFTASISFSNLARELDEFHRIRLLPNMQLPSNLTVPGIRISTINSSINSILVPLASASSYIAHEKITLRDVVFFYQQNVQLRQGSFIAHGKYDLCETEFNVTMETLDDDTFKLTGSSQAPLDLSTVENVFLTAVPSGMLIEVIKRTDLLVKRLMNPKIEAYIGKELLVKFSGESYFGASATPITLEFFGGKVQGRDIFLARIESSDMSLRQAVQMFTEYDLPFLDFIQYSAGESSVGVTLSSQNLELKKSRAQGFKHLLSTAFGDIIPAGMSFAYWSTIPTRCNGSHVCEILQVMFGSGSQFTLRASADVHGLKLSWHFFNLSKTALTSFNRGEMTIQLQFFPLSDPSVHGSVFNSDQPSKGLQFRGQLTHQVNRSYLEAKFRTRIVWRHVFGMEHLILTNLQLGVSLPKNKTMQSSMRGQADVELGSGCSAADNGGENKSVRPKCLTGHVYMGLSDASAGQYFSGTLSPVNLQKLMEVCGIEHQLPGALASIGFPEGLQISIAHKSHDLRNLGGPHLRAGFTLTGKIRILGIETSGAISLLPNKFLIDAQILEDERKITFDDLKPLTASEDSVDELQLYLKARVRPEPFVKAHINGHTRLFGIFEVVRMLVTRETLQIHLMTDISKPLKINVHVTTNYSSNRNETHFAASIVLESGLSKLTRLASKKVVQVLETEMSQLKSAKGEVQRRRRDCVKAIKRECTNCLSNNSLANNLTECRTERTRRSIPRSSKDERQPIDAPLDVCQRIVMRHCHATEGACHNACALVSSRVNETCAAYEAAAKSQRELERSLRWVQQAEQFMYKDLFQIHSISFKTDVTSANFDQLDLDTSLEVTIFGQKQKLDGLRMKFDEFVKLGSEIAKYAVEWYRNAKPETKRKLRHPDNRPRSSPS